MYTFHRYKYFAVKLFLETSWIFYGAAESAVHLFMVCHRDCGDLLHITWVMAKFRYYRKKRSFSFGLERNMHWSGSNSAHKCILCNNRYVLKFIQIGRYLWEWWPKKPVFDSQQMIAMPTGHGPWPPTTNLRIFCHLASNSSLSACNLALRSPAESFTLVSCSNCSLSYSAYTAAALPASMLQC